MISCLCPTYEPRESLWEAIECFDRQDYPQHQRELLVLCDHPSGVERISDYKGLTTICVDRRFRTLPEKYNALVGMARGQILMPWEDDDLYEPWHLAAHVEAIGDESLSRLSKPSVCRQHMPDGQTYLRRDVGNNRLRRFHASIAYTRAAFTGISGYPITDRADFDHQFMCRLQKWCTLVDPIVHDPRPSYVNRWRQSSNGPDDTEWYNHGHQGNLRPEPV